MAPRVRFAPSPTGYLHVGGARTALFNWLYARRHGGVFILRIEDTDAERSSWEMVGGILEGMKWLGLDWDEGPEVGGPHAPYFQSERLERYRTMAERLVSEGHAYYCYCSSDRLREERERAEAGGEAWKYDRACLALAPQRVAEFEATGVARAIRFKVPEGVTRFDDAVHGAIEFEHANIEDFVILRSDGFPTYHLSVVVDDVDMRITHVIRGDDHISNTPKHVLLFGAFGFPAPRFAHVPLILGADKKRLSKRHGATSVTEYRRLGYLPEAMSNFLALLGWSPGDDRELMSRDELVEAFSLEGISGGNAVFNTEKLDWMNGQYIARLSAEELAGRVEPLLHDAGLWPAQPTRDQREFLQRVLALLRPRAKRLTDFVEQARPFLADTVEYERDAVEKHLAATGLDDHVAALVTALRTVTPFDESHVEAAVRGTASERGLKAGSLIHATRVAVTGRTTSPGLFEVLALLGRERTVDRLNRLHAFLAARN
ncbi:MAG TPA: glutamate--tRNA ligase [Thermoanaerobaculia bacterium]|nr:glutamate--tRNA ligase [Thermoanaerobaculia bacterium]